MMMLSMDWCWCVDDVRTRGKKLKSVMKLGVGGEKYEREGGVVWGNRGGTKSEAMAKKMTRERGKGGAGGWVGVCV